MLADARLRPPAHRRRRRRPVPAGPEGPAAGLRRVLALIDVRRVGRIDYQAGLDLQQQLVEERRAGRIPDTLILCEHPPVITLGVRTRRGPTHIVASAEVLAAEGVTVHETGRGGDVTCHGPGQLVGYPIFDLRPDRQDVHRYVRDLEEALIRAIADFGVAGRRVEGLTGVWVGEAGREAKVAAIGVRVSRWITSHGFALNVGADLRHFELIVPCGIADRSVTSLEQLLGRPVPLPDVEAAVEEGVRGVFHRDGRNGV